MNNATQSSRRAKAVPRPRNRGNSTNVLRLWLVIPVEVGHHVLEFGRVLLAELAKDKEAAQTERVARLVLGLVPPDVEAKRSQIITAPRFVS
jgi:hypothetical protein